MLPTIYATADDVAEYAGDPSFDVVPTVAELRRASILVTKTCNASFDLTDPEVLAVLKAATCEQVLYWIASRDDGRTEWLADHSLDGDSAKTMQEQEGTGAAALCSAAFDLLWLSELWRAGITR